MAYHTILIIDDTPDHRSIVGMLLRSAGFRVLEAIPGDGALEQARAERPDLILTTLSLPGQPAWETARLLRNEPVLAETPILGTTIYNTLLPWAWVRRIGCNDYVDKPYDIDDLLRRINQLLPQLPGVPFVA
ncbi:MAG: response regulator [Chloroflexi bacterium SZAS-1]|jgi:CheY-like chemotaxis protein|nr:response regulator [Chloroflexi bacterium SZAS-1]HNP85242.1 response regulator [Kouleothrix sp.]